MQLHVLNVTNIIILTIKNKNRPINNKNGLSKIKSETRTSFCEITEQNSM